MKTMKVLLLVLALACVPSYVYSAGLGDIRLSYLEGDVQINSETTRDWVIASMNIPLYEGDRVWVPDDGKAEMHFRKGTVVRLNEKTSADILTYDRDLLQLYLNVGSIYVNYKGARDSILQINTPVTTIRAYYDAVLRVDVLSNGQTYVSVYRGTVYTDYREGKSAISEGNMALIRGYFREEIYPLSAPDNWTRWNMQRDMKIYGSYGSTRYLPDELRYYSYDFDTNGRWIYVRDYGYCWQPTVMVSVGWAPYRHGRWVWWRGDYVWISYEPWGWVPYHYGRWSFSVSIGWFWVPPARGSVYWGPGYVGWIQTPTYVSWVPLAPGEIYYGYGYYGPHSVNLFNVNINKIVIKDKYKNARVKDGVTIIHRDTFITGKPAEIRIRENPFLSEKIRPGRPDIQPEKRTAMPIIKDVPERKLPPPMVKESQVRELREKAPMQKQRDIQMQERMIAPKAQPGERRPEIQDRKAPDDRLREKTPAEIRKDNQIQEQRQLPIRKDDSRQIAPPDTKQDKGRQIAPLQDRKAPDDRLREITPSEIRKDNQIQEQRQLPIRKDDSRQFAPPDTKQERGREIAPSQQQKLEIHQRQPKEQEKGKPEEIKPQGDEGVPRDKGGVQFRHR